MLFHNTNIWDYMMEIEAIDIILKNKMFLVSNSDTQGQMRRC